MATLQEALSVAQDYHRAGQLSAAEDIYQRILAAVPQHAQTLYLLGVLHLQTDRGAQALELIGQAVALDPNQPAWHNDLGEVCRTLHRSEAAECYRRAIRLQPDFAIAHYNLGLALWEQGRVAEAIPAYQRAIELQPDFAPAYNNLGVAYLQQNLFEPAIACLTRLLELRPDDRSAATNLSVALAQQGRFEAATKLCRQALLVVPGDPQIMMNLAGALRGCGRNEEALALLDQVLALDPQNVDAHSNRLLTRQYAPDVSLQRLLDDHVVWDQRHAQPFRATGPSWTNPATENRLLRLGFVSPDLGRHAVGQFLVRVLEELDRSQFTTLCYSDRTQPDDMTLRLRRASGYWRDVRGLSDEDLARQIRQDGIDVLFDLAGHTQGNRLSVFARRPAPVQITWLGYVGTTGLEAMDYLLADGQEIPPPLEPFYRERVLRMPDGYACYDPPVDAPPPGPPPVMSNGWMTFGSFNNPAKLSPATIALWAKVLARIPGSRLLLKFRGMDDPAVASRLHTLFAQLGIGPQRLQLSGWSPHVELLQAYSKIDLSLDTLPYGGGLTTCESLWMGVPVLTRPGETFASRHALSHLSAAGLTETIAADDDSFVELAARLAADLPHLAELRAGLRAQVAHSPLCDGPRFARNFERLIQDAWRHWCRPRSS